MKLTRQQWLALNSLADGIEPFEIVYQDYSDTDASVDPLALLEDLFGLYRAGLVAFRQEPVKGSGQEFRDRPLQPACAADIAGDLAGSFEQFRKRRTWLQSPGDVGLPFGIYVEMTPSGRKEWDREEYQSFYSANDG